MRDRSRDVFLLSISSVNKQPTASLTVKILIDSPLVPIIHFIKHLNKPIDITFIVHNNNIIW